MRIKGMRRCITIELDEDQINSEEETTVISPLTIRKFKWWKCPNCQNVSTAEAAAAGCTSTATGSDMPPPGDGLVVLLSNSRLTPAPDNVVMNAALAGHENAAGNNVNQEIGDPKGVESNPSLVQKDNSEGSVRQENGSGNERNQEIIHPNCGEMESVPPSVQESRSGKAAEEFGHEPICRAEEIQKNMECTTPRVAGDDQAERLPAEIPPADAQLVHHDKEDVDQHYCDNPNVNLSLGSGPILVAKPVDEKATSFCMGNAELSNMPTYSSDSRPNLGLGTVVRSRRTQRVHIKDVADHPQQLQANDVTDANERAANGIAIVAQGGSSQRQKRFAARGALYMVFSESETEEKIDKRRSRRGRKRKTSAAKAKRPCVSKRAKKAAAESSSNAGIVISDSAAPNVEVLQGIVPRGRKDKKDFQARNESKLGGSSSGGGRETHEAETGKLQSSSAAHHEEIVAVKKGLPFDLNEEIPVDDSVSPVGDTPNFVPVEALEGYLSQQNFSDCQNSKNDGSAAFQGKRANEFDMYFVDQNHASDDLEAEKEQNGNNNDSAVPSRTSVEILCPSAASERGEVDLNAKTVEQIMGLLETPALIPSSSTFSKPFTPCQQHPKLSFDNSILFEKSKVINGDPDVSGKSPVLSLPVVGLSTSSSVRVLPPRSKRGGRAVVRGRGRGRGRSSSPNENSNQTGDRLVLGGASNDRILCSHPDIAICEVNKNPAEFTTLPESKNEFIISGEDGTRRKRRGPRRSSVVAMTKRGRPTKDQIALAK